MLRRIIVSIVIFFTFSAKVMAANTVAANHAARNKITIEEFKPTDLPEIHFLDAKGKKHLLEEFEDKVVLLNFWATWCNTCTTEMPELDRLQKEFKKKPFKIITLSEDFRGMAVVAEFFKNNEIKFLEPYVDEKNALFNEFHIIGLPTAILINKDNKAVAKITGAVDWRDEMVRKLLLSYIESTKSNDIQNSQELVPAKPDFMITVKKPESQTDDKTVNPDKVSTETPPAQNSADPAPSSTAPAEAKDNASPQKPAQETSPNKNQS